MKKFHNIDYANRARRAMHSFGNWSRGSEYQLYTTGIHFFLRGGGCCIENLNDLAAEGAKVGDSSI